MSGPPHLIEFFHGYTYSGHPLAIAAAEATLEQLAPGGDASRGWIAKAAALAPVLEDAVHSLRGEPLVADIRNLGLAAAIDVTPLPGRAGLQAFRVFEHALDRGLYLRFTGETLALAPPFISTADEIRGAIETLRASLRAAASH